MSTPGSRPTLSRAHLDNYNGTDSETDAMNSDQENGMLRNHHHYYHHHHHHHIPPTSTKQAGLRFKVVRYEEYRQKWGTKGKASVWDEHLPGVPTSLPPKSEIELKNEQNLLPQDEELFLSISNITFPHHHCHQHPVLSKRSHYERIALKMIHYQKCDQAKKPNANGKLEVSKVDEDRQQSPSRRTRRRKHKQSTQSTGGGGATANITQVPTQSLSPPEVTPQTNSTATVAVPTNSEEHFESVPLEPEEKQEQMEELPSETQLPPSRIEIDPNMDDTLIPNPPTSPVPSDLPDSSELQSTVKKGRFTVLSREDVSPPPQPLVESALPVTVHTHRGSDNVSAVERETSKDVSQNARDVALLLQKYQPQNVSLFTPENVQAAFNWISHFRSNPSESSEESADLQLGFPEGLDQGALSMLNSEDANFQVTLDNIAQAVVYLKDKSQTKQLVPSSQSSTQASVQMPPSLSNSKINGILTSTSQSPTTNPPQPVLTNSTPAPTNGPSNHQIVESRLEARIHGVTDRFQEALMSALKSEMDPLSGLLQQYRAALSQREAEIATLNLQLQSLLTEEAYQQNLARQKKMSKPE